MTVAVTLPPHLAALAAHGIKTWLDSPHRPRVEPGEVVLLHAGKEAPKHGFQDCGWIVYSSLSYPGTLSARPKAAGGPYIDLPLGVVVATGRVGKPVPIVGGKFRRADERNGTIENINGRHLAMWGQTWYSRPGGTNRDISDQLPYGTWTPGRWAVPLSDVRRLEKPVREYPACPFGCIASGTIHECSPQSRALCVVPVRGRGGIWRPDPALCGACEVTS